MRMASLFSLVLLIVSSSRCFREIFLLTVAAGLIIRTTFINLMFKICNQNLFKSNGAGKRSESRYLDVEKTEQDHFSLESFQKLLAHQNSTESTSMSHPGKNKKNV